MPRDPGTGVYTLPLPPTEPRRIPVTGWANTTVEDLAAALNNIPGSALAPGSVDTTQLADNSVTNAKMADNAIDTAELADNSVTNAKMADNAIDTAELVDGAVTGPKLADGAVTGPKLAPYNLHVGTLPGETPNAQPNIELGRTDGVASLPHIDFHAGATPTDYDARIICSTGTGVAGEGDMTISATPLTLLKGQLQFPATQNPSTDPNTLDDYEEGTFTPTLTFTTPGNLSVVYSTRVGLYTKVGDLVYFTLRVVTTTFTHTTASGALRVSGLPFSQVGAGSLGVGIGRVQGLTASSSTLCAYIVPGASEVVMERTDGATTTGVTTTVAPTGIQKDIMIFGVYKTT